MLLAESDPLGHRVAIGGGEAIAGRHGPAGIRRHHVARIEGFTLAPDHRIQGIHVECRDPLGQRRHVRAGVHHLRIDVAHPHPAKLDGLRRPAAACRALSHLALVGTGRRGEFAGMSMRDRRHGNHASTEANEFQAESAGLLPWQHPSGGFNRRGHAGVILTTKPWPSRRSAGGGTRTSTRRPRAPRTPPAGPQRRPTSAAQTPCPA